MAKSTTRKKKSKAGATPDGFPLWKHPSGRWCKKIRGKAHYFGKVADDPDGEKALERFLDEKDDLLAGRTPRRHGQSGPMVHDLLETFLDVKWGLVESGELSKRTFRDYKITSDGIIDNIGKKRLLSDLGPDDFAGYRKKLAKRLGPVALGNEIQRIRTVFGFAYDSDLIDRPIKFGPGFKRPSKRVVRVARKKNGLRMLEAEQLRTVLNSSKGQLKAMILLGINAGLGAADLARLRNSHLDLKAGWLDYPRPKTGVDRRVPLWPETIKAIREVIAKRPKPKDKKHAGLVFITKYGFPWVRMSPLKEDKDGKPRGGVPLDAIGAQFSKVLKETDLKRPGLGFYCLRHTLETIGGEVRDQIALDAIMGHIRDDMASVYRERISDERLRAVTDYVRNWLFPPKKKRVE